MKQLGNYYAEPLTHLINQSISQGLFTEEMKLAKILPIYKSDDEQLVNNYRPISILQFFSIIFEKLYLNILSNLWMKTNCFTAINLDSENNIPPAMQSSP